MTVRDADLVTVFGLLPEEDYEKYKKEQFSEDVKQGYCNQSAKITPIQGVYVNESVTLKDQIPSEGVYYTFFISCNSSAINEDGTKIKVTFDFMNGDSHLDARAFPGLVEQPIAMIIVIVIAVAWIINWVFHWGVKIYIHYCFTATFILAVVSRVARYAYLAYEDKHGFSQGLQVFKIICVLIFQVWLYFSMLLAAKGWCVIRKSVTFSEMFLAMASTIVLCVSSAVLSYAKLGDTAWIVLSLVMIVSLCIYGRELTRSRNDGSMHIIAHLLAISNAGIDPESTPIWHKKRMFDILQWTVTGYLALITIRLIVLMITMDILWVDPMMEDIADIALLIAIYATYKLRGGSTDGYAMIDEIGDEFMLDDIEGVAKTGLPKGGKKWESGMELPSPPTISTTPSVITLESPDGVTEVHVRPGEATTEEKEEA